MDVNCNRITGFGAGVYVTGNEEGATIQGNLIENNHLVGLQADLNLQEGVQILDNIFHSNPTGIIVLNANNLIKGNTFEGSGDGIRLWPNTNFTNNQIEENTFDLTTGLGLYVYNGTTTSSLNNGNSVVQNTFKGVTPTYIWNRTGSFELDLSDNTFEIDNALKKVEDMSLDDLFKLEDRFKHVTGVSTPINNTGLLRVRPNQLFVTTNSGSIQRAVNIALPEDTIYVSAGLFKESVIVKKNLALKGGGNGETIWRGNGITDRSLTILRDNSAPENIHVEVGGFTFETEKNKSIFANWDVSYDEALTLDIHQNKFKHVNTRNIGTDYSIWVNNAIQVPRDTIGAIRIYNNNFESVTGGILIDNSRAVDIIDNYFNTSYEGIAFNYFNSPNKDLGEHFTKANTLNHNRVDWAFAINSWHGVGEYTMIGSRFENNLITNSGFSYGIMFGVDRPMNPKVDYYVNNNSLGDKPIETWGVNYEDITIDATCNWWSTTKAINVLSKVPAETEFIFWLVDGTNNRPGLPGFHPRPNTCIGGPVENLTKSTYYANIQDAVNDANTDDIIQLSEFKYNENVTIDKPVTIRGEAIATREQVVLDGSNLPKSSAIKINNNVTGVNIQHLTIQNYDGLTPNSSAGIYASASNDSLSITDVVIKNNQNMSGIYANGPVKNILIDSSSIINHGPGARGVVIWNGLKENITITNNYLENNNCCGIELQDGSASGVMISGNEIKGADNAIGVVGLTKGAGPNLISSNNIEVKGRYGIEIKNPDGTGNDNLEEDGTIIVFNNSVTFKGTTDNRDLAGISVFRRGVQATNINIPTGVVIRSNTVSDFRQSSASTGFGIVVEGANHTLINNNLNNNDTGIQQQSGHQPYGSEHSDSNNLNGNGNDANLNDLYFGRGNSPLLCDIFIGENNFTNNTTDQRVVINGLDTGLEVKPTVDSVANLEVCNNSLIPEINFTGNSLPDKSYSWRIINNSIGLDSSGTGSIESFSIANISEENIEILVTVVPHASGVCDGDEMSFNISVLPSPSDKPFLSPTQATICEGQEVELNVTCDVGVGKWSSGELGSRIFVSPNITTKYTAWCVVGTEVICQEGIPADSIEVIVMPRPEQLVIITDNTTICEGNSVELSVDASSCDNGVLQWYEGNSSLNVSARTVTVTPSRSTTYKVICESKDILHCYSDDAEITIHVNINDLTAPTISGEMIIKEPASVELTANCSTGTVVWYDQLENVQYIGSPFNTPVINANTAYIVRCVADETNPKSCMSSSVIQSIIFNDFEIVSHPDDISVCNGQNAWFTVKATGHSVAYQWQEFDGNNWYNLSDGGIYSGTTTNHLNITIADKDRMESFKYRVAITNTAVDANEPKVLTSSEALLNISSSALAYNLSMESTLVGITSVFQAVQTIVANNLILGGNVKYFAGNSMSFEPGFEVDASGDAVFEAKIQIPCTNTSAQKDLPLYKKK